jgi:hypothetical protein
MDTLQHHPRHDPVVPCQELLLGRPVPVADLAQHPADSLVDRVVLIVQSRSAALAASAASIALRWY